MSGTTIPNPSSDNNFWANYIAASVPISSKQEKKEMLSEYGSAIDESPEFYDPYSDLNLFLSQKIKKEMHQCDSSKKWSLKLQEELLAKIAPEFRSKFPQYRLGITALRKTWEKIAHYSQQIKEQKEAITQDGKLNIHFFIKENLRSYTHLKSSSHFHPSHFAHQLAVKMSECIATMDGIRPQLDELTKVIWAIQRHLLSDTDPEQTHSPYDEYDKIDQLIVRKMLEITAKDPQISYSDLEYQMKEALFSLHELPSFSSLEQMTSTISALLAEKLYATSPFHTLFFTEQKTAIHHFIKRHSSLYKKAEHAPSLAELVRRIIALYKLASGMPKTLSETAVKEAVLAHYPVEKAETSLLSQSFLAFISAELVLMRTEEFCRSPQYVAEAIWSAYQEAALLPPLEGKETDLLEIAIWKTLSETEGLLEKLPYRIGQRIEEEIAGILIENPTQTFSTLVYETVKLFKKTKELIQVKSWDNIEKKIHLWAIQGDMLCRWIRLDQESTLLRLILQKWQAHSSPLPHHLFVSEICQEYLKWYPELAPYITQLSLRVWILYKYSWYSLFGSKEESSFDRFLKWHVSSLLCKGLSLDREHLVSKLEEIVHRTLPLVPFDKKQADAVLA